MHTDLLLKTLSVQTCSFQEEAMVSFILESIQKLENASWFLDEGNLYVTKGTSASYFCLAAHLDTVHPIEEHYSIRQEEEWVFSLSSQTGSPIGIGGDDKVGVFLALEMLRQSDTLKAVFFSNEEVGCLGSRKAQMPFFQDCKAVIQCDRRGNQDVVRTTQAGVSFFGNGFSRLIASVIKKHGYRFFDTGGITDVLQLKQKGLAAPVTNLSCGYYHPHSIHERVNVLDVEKCFGLLQALYNSVLAPTPAGFHQP